MVEVLGGFRFFQALQKKIKENLLLGLILICGQWTKLGLQCLVKKIYLWYPQNSVWKSYGGRSCLQVVAVFIMFFIFVTL